MVTPSILIVEIIAGPYVGHIVRVSPRGRLFHARLRYGEHPLEPHEVVEVDGCHILATGLAAAERPR